METTGAFNGIQTQDWLIMSWMLYQMHHCYTISSNFIQINLSELCGGWQ